MHHIMQLSLLLLNIYKNFPCIFWKVFFRIYLFLTALKIFTYYAIHSFEVYNLDPFAVFTELYNQHCNLRIFSLCQKETLLPLTFDPQSHHLSSSALGNQ